MASLAPVAWGGSNPYHAAIARRRGRRGILNPRERTIMKRKALIVQGGWDGHQPKEVAEIFRRVLAEDGFEVEVSDTLDAFKDESKLMGLSLIVPVWTMGKIAGSRSTRC